MKRRQKLVTKINELFGSINNFWYINKKYENMGVVKEKGVNDILRNAAIKSKINYYQEKIDQWDLLDSFGEVWDKDDIAQYKDWVDRLKDLRNLLD